MVGYCRYWSGYVTNCVGLLFWVLKMNSSQSIHSFIHLSIHSSICPFIHPSVHSFIHLSIHSSICPFIYPSVHSFIHLSIHSFICPFIHSSIHQDFLKFQSSSSHYIQRSRSRNSGRGTKSRCSLYGYLELWNTSSCEHMGLDQWKRHAPTISDIKCRLWNTSKHNHVVSNQILLFCRLLLRLVKMILHYWCRTVMIKSYFING